MPAELTWFRVVDKSGFTGRNGTVCRSLTVVEWSWVADQTVKYTPMLSEKVIQLNQFY